MAEIPRRKVAELATRWDLEKIPHVIVEGPRDARFLRLLQREDHCDGPLRTLDVIPVDAIELPAALLEAHGLLTTGARQRVIACIREVETQHVQDGFRGIIDADIDVLKGCNFSTDYIWYTDYGCMDGYCWSPQVLKRLAIQARCDESLRTAAQATALFKSINVVCAVLASIRYAAFANETWNLKIHRSTKSLSINGGVVSLNPDSYLDQCGLGKAQTQEAKDAVAKYCADFKVIDPKLTLNGHDLVWVLEFALRSLTAGPKGKVTEEIIKEALVAHGVAAPELCSERMFVALGDWATALNAPSA